MTCFYYFYFATLETMVFDYQYCCYCDAADEMNNNWEKYTYETMYPEIWRYFVKKQTKYYIYLDAIPDFIFYDNCEILEKFSKYCKKIDWD